MKNKKLISIDIGSRNLHFVEGKVKGSEVEIQKYSVFPLPPNCVSNGYIEDEEIMKSSIRKALSQNKMHTRHVVVTVQSTNILVKEFEIPYVTLKELKSVVEYEMEQLITADGKEFVVEFRILDEIVEHNIRKYRIRAAAMPEKMADDYYNLFKHLRMKPVALDINSNCISKFFKGDLVINGEIIDENQNIALIDIGYTNTSIYVYSNKKIEFSRFVPIGTSNIDISIASHFKISIEEAEIMRIDQLDINSEYISDNLSENKVELGVVLSEFKNNWIGEIQKVLQYFESRHDLNRIKEIFIFGGGSNIKGLSLYMKKIINMPVSKIETVKKIKLNKRSSRLNCELYLNATGCIIR